VVIHVRARRRARVAAALVAAVGVAVAMSGCSSSGGAGSASADGQTTVNMVMEWPTADGFWIPWIVAKEKGYFEDAGINLKIVAPPNTSATIQYLGTGKADIAFSTTVDVVTARSQGAPVVSIGKYGSSNNWGLISRGGTPIKAADLKGKKIGTYTDAWSDAQLQIMLASAGLKKSDVTLVTADDDTVPLLVQNKVSAITGITNAEGSELESLGVKDYSVAYSKDNGAPDAPVFSIGANSQWLQSHQAVAKKFMAATLKGLNYARAHQSEAVDAMLKAYPKSETKAFATLQWTATADVFGPASKSVTLADLQSTDATWSSIADAAKKFGVIKTADSASDYYTNEALK
jgi:putative hydroxymethylpyrimidine transport system substrate-binding protein